MKKECLLETDGFLICIGLNSLNKESKNIDSLITFLLDASIEKLSIQSVPTYIAVNDLQRLANYFEQHVKYLQQDPNRESHPFVPVELGFQVQALQGEVRSERDGEFSIRFMVNVGKRSATSTNVYVGGEAVVTLENIKNFISSIRTALTELCM